MDTDPGEDDERVRGAVASWLPDYRVESVARIGAGLDNAAYEVNGELVVRLANGPEPDRVLREARLLEAVARVSPLPVPQPLFVAASSGCLVYPKLPGVPLLDLPGPSRATHAVPIAGTLGALLAALHTVAADEMAGLVAADDRALDEWHDEAAELYETVSALVPPSFHARVEAFLGTPPPGSGWVPVFSHNDLGIEHVLVDPDTWAVTGIIDWSDAAIVDPAYDFGLIFRDLGPDALDAAVRAYGVSTDLVDLRDRAVFYARCSVFEDLAYGRDAYVRKSIASMEWLYPGQSR